MHKLFALLDNQLHTPAFSVEQLADELAVSHRGLHRNVSALTGTNANKLVRSYRLRKANLFFQVGFPVSEAAERVGFEEFSYFTKSFKAPFSLTPSAYLQAQRTD